MNAVRATCLPLTLLLALGGCASPDPADPLPSWNEGSTKQAILAFVERVTIPGSPDFVPEAERIAVFDNDGTLWQERPTVEVAFLLTRLKAMAAADPALARDPAVKAALAKDLAYLHEAGPQAILELFGLVYGGVSQDAFIADANAFLASAKDPATGRKLTDLTYQPMRELLDYLRSKGFQTWICSGGTREMMRLISDSLYGIPPEQVIGTALELTWKEQHGKWILWREPKIATFNDQTAKPVNLSLALGRPPIMAVGNEGGHGDIAMLTYSQSRTGPSFQMVVDHDDAAREHLYQEPDSGSLKAAASHGWTVISMKNDWKTVYRP